jgi:choline monooxygenase
MAEIPDIDPDLNLARALRGACYQDPAFLELEQRAIFRHRWLFAAHASQLAQHGDFVSATLGDQPIVLTRDDATLRGFHNVCRHRGGPLTVGCGRQRQFTCRYHGWSYGLDGRLARAPLMQAETDGHGGALDLRPLRVETAGGLVFATSNAAAPELDAWLATLTPELARVPLDGLVFVRRRTFDVQANWKIYVENYLEGYHVPAVHPGLNREIDFRAYTTELGDHWTCQHAPMAAGSGAERVYRDGAQARYYWLYPNLMLNFYDGLLQTNVVEPVNVEHTRVHFDWYAPAGVDISRQMAFSDEVQAEDAVICAALQRNYRSPAFEPGPYSRQFEQGVHHFHRLYAADLALNTIRPTGETST